MHYVWSKQPDGTMSVVLARSYATARSDGTADVYVKDMQTGVGSLVWSQHFANQAVAMRRGDDHLHEIEQLLHHLGRAPAAPHKSHKPKFRVHVTYTQQNLGEVVVRADTADAADSYVNSLYDDGDLDTDNFEINDQWIEVTAVEELDESEDATVDYPDNDEEET